MEIIVALIAVFGVLGAPVITGVMQRRVQRENKEDHAAVIAELTAVRDGMGRVERKVDSHITWHAHSAPNVVQVFPREDAIANEA